MYYASIKNMIFRDEREKGGASMLHSPAKTCALFMYVKPVRNLESPDGHVYSQVVFLNKPGFNNSQKLEHQICISCNSH